MNITDTVSPYKNGGDKAQNIEEKWRNTIVIFQQNKPVK